MCSTFNRCIRQVLKKAANQEDPRVVLHVAMILVIQSAFIADINISLSLPQIHVSDLPLELQNWKGMLSYPYKNEFIIMIKKE